MKRAVLPRYHALDILTFALTRIKAGQRVVLVVLTEISGASARPIGTPMIVCENGEYAGYLSNGCVDADIALHAKTALKDGKSKTVRYGAGSPYLDVRLPCGGGITAAVIPDPNIDALEMCLNNLMARQSITFSLGELAPAQHYYPPLHICSAGRGENLLFFVKTAIAAGISVQVLCPDENEVEALSCLGATMVPFNARDDTLVTMDRWTAFITLFHDHDYELPLLQEALASEAFYIGAMGSRNTHAARLHALAIAGADKAALSRLRGPIGLVPSMRDAGRLSVSVLAEIIDAERTAF
ncbi:XdhC family protein [Fretibacter rubidus]|uniref:XdhC family protein n=1 Tax=Fretibacter rubidus TaxID=570162 RepID=UPI00352BB182